ncbi:MULTISPECIES: 1-deoxy-D-xylulose-5-phosphate synthase [unclassified Acidovorax]|jgi:1-deoxy-D-xylulose-5-phosphate synthase|uniref:1-deoxy-D-xylulose-5-phosphate synthase n=1 Tax=unclassified Acidovorax TaxID=2684926 RepID=UPI000BDBD658|nr:MULTISPECIES: 1-deoxy-D-xylulose-5-phosphate synthase [unclassified Acidovorax]OZA57470.1 MAG: 1-deoxy-D-xylulose-5-phosphate synthase [Acidovorax sp. 17-64-282]HQS22057.1 1-deoxy-D-xylulose-5-phosphate synthase [Acidovorax defluvii]OYY85752.1 MAG: 1-deoxy-D-xylulose-5-phosphate synthase [Acidovorax sp. 28-64-14]OYZ44851.1 MAG: 1-deoxy-D-xylulose-5-phosphate synthase [Acidovorax sp. 16-64-162]OYZ66527.1 MAG: 1-deoxy-D-xylulose-5-phosphate synthase [Acidovorax sp. 24-64-9]
MSTTSFPLLQTINDPADLRRLARADLKQLATELRAFVIESVSQTGGHLSSNLGTVELTVALHHVFNTPEDRLVWDVGHQTYPHKILTGRRDRMHTLRQLGGISGFPQRAESVYDTFGTAHSSTSISAALGMALAAQRKGEDRHAVAIIGDGAMTAGMAFEALNNAGVADANLLVILNDNDMSISPPVGALNRYLAQLMSGQFYAAAKNVGKTVLRPVPPLLELAKRLEQQAKGMVVPATLFEKFGFNYIGPIDGHDLDSLIPTLENIKGLKGPQFLHVVTKKGQGYKLAEADPVAYHGPGKFDPAVGLVKSTAAPKQTFTQVFGEWLCDMAAQDDRLVGITPAMREGSGMVEFHKRFPDRYYDVGIAEQHAVTFAAGMACEGVKPVVAIYSTFLQRGYDQMIHDVALQNLPVVFALDRAGLVGADGATHAGAYDIPFVRCIPNMSMACPADERECRQLLSTAFAQDHPVAVRYPRGSGAGVAPLRGLEGLPFGKGEIRRERKGGQVDAATPRIAILAFGTSLYPALQAAEALDATVVNMRWAKPLDTALLLEVAARHDALVTLEEGAIMGGAGSAVMEALAAAKVVVPVLQLGLPDVFIEHGDPAKLLSLQGLDAEGIRLAIAARFGPAPAL